MIEIVKPVVNEEKHEIVCPNCNTLLRYENSDLYMCYSEQGFDCPNCETWIVAKTYPSFEFPTSFSYTSADAVKLSDEKTQKWIDDCVKKLKENKDWNYNMLSIGDTIIFVTKDSDCNEIDCYVAKNYYHAFEGYNC